MACSAHRAKLNEEDGVKVSVNDLSVWCVAQALIKEPRVNVNLVGDDHSSVQTPPMSPWRSQPMKDSIRRPLRQPTAQSPAEISAATAELADKAQRRQADQRGYLGRLFHCLESRDVWHHAIHGDRQSAHGRDPGHG